MAVSVDLITGHGESDHITSFDARTFNRALFGGNKYTLEDGDYLSVEVNASTGTINIASGSLMWSGMHIRVEKEGSLAYAIPASSNTVYVWLHYKRNAATLVETVEFVTTTGTTPENSLIQDKISDEATEAYTLFCSFYHDTSANTSAHLKMEFGYRASLDSSIKQQQANNASFQSNVNTQINAFTTETSGQVNEYTQIVTEKSQEIDEKIAEFQKSVSKPVLRALGDDYTRILNSHLGADSKSFSEPISNFTFFAVAVTVNARVVVKMLPRGMVEYANWANNVDVAYVDGNSLYFVSFSMARGSSGLGADKFYPLDIHAKKYSVNALGGVGVDNIDLNSINVQVYGIGRIK